MVLQLLPDGIAGLSVRCSQKFSPYLQMQSSFLQKKKLLLLQQLAITGSREKFLLFLLSRNLFLSLKITCKICQVLVYVFNHLR